jgi:hypothetical protein
MSTPEIEIAKLAHAWETAIDSRDKYFAYKPLREARERAAAEFAESRGWKISKRRFSVGQLQRGNWFRSRESEIWAYPLTEHPYFFIDSESNPVGVVAHLYHPWPTIEAAADEAQLSVEQLSWSWYRPGSTIGVLFTRGKSSITPRLGDSVRRPDLAAKFPELI